MKTDNQLDLHHDKPKWRKDQVTLTLKIAQRFKTGWTVLGPTIVNICNRKVDVIIFQMTIYTKLSKIFNYKKKLCECVFVF